MVACFVSAATSTDCQLEGDAQHHLWAEAFVASAVPRTVDARVNCIELVGGDGEAAAERRPGHVDEHRSPERSGAGHSRLGTWIASCTGVARLHQGRARDGDARDRGRCAGHRRVREDIDLLVIGRHVGDLPVLVRRSAGREQEGPRGSRTITGGSRESGGDHHHRACARLVTQTGAEGLRRGALGTAPGECERARQQRTNAPPRCPRPRRHTGDATVAGSPVPLRHQRAVGARHSAHCGRGLAPFSAASEGMVCLCWPGRLDLE